MGRLTQYISYMNLKEEPTELEMKHFYPDVGPEVVAYKKKLIKEGALNNDSDEVGNSEEGK